MLSEGCPVAEIAECVPLLLTELQIGHANSSRSGVLCAGGESRGTVCSEGCYGVVKTAGVPDGRLVRWPYVAKRPRHQLHW